MKKLLSAILGLIFLNHVSATVIRVQGTNSNTYNPSTISAKLGDTLNFVTFGAHDALEVSKASWDANDDTPLEGGFSVPLSGGMVVLKKVGTFYFVCTPHIKSHGMKGSVTVTAPAIKYNTFVVKSDTGNRFVPNVLNVRLGDTIDFQLASDINAVEVSKTQYDNGGSVSNGGFLTPNGGGKVVINRLGTLYFTSEKYSAFGMKGIINVRERGDFYVAKLTGVQEEFPVLSMAKGEIVVRHDGDTLYVSGSFSRLSGDYTNAHFHRGFAGTTGGIQIVTPMIIDSTKRAGTINSKFAISAAQKAMLQTREFYFNVHSTVSPGGEIRGQVVPESESYYHLNLVGSSEMPPILTPAHGSMFAELTGNTLIVTGSAKEITSGYTNSHLHLGYAGQSGGVQIALKPTILDSAKTSVTWLAADNIYTLTPDQLGYLKSNRLYGNVHSTTYAPGEIRGQLTPIATAKFRVFFSGANEPVPVYTQATGGLVLNLVDSTLIVSGFAGGLESDLATATRGGAHIHLGVAGRNGGIQYDLKNNPAADKRSTTFLADSNTIKLTANNINDLFARKWYANVHSLNNPGGEMRGQILPEVQNILLGNFYGMQENRSQLTTGRGNIITEINGNRITVSGSVERLLDKINRNGFAHIHRGAAGQNGGIITALSITHATDSLSATIDAVNNAYTASAGMQDSLRSRLTYANIHTSRAPGGEIRAQLNGEAVAYFHSIMSGEGESNPVNTKATGGVIAELLSDKKVIVHGSFAALDSKWNGGAHIHAALPGSNGGVRYNLTVTANADSLGGIIPAFKNIITFTDGAIDSLRKRAHYTNIHTTKSPGGEIRGTLHNFSNGVFSAKLTGLNESPIVAPSGNGTIKAELLDTKLTVVGSFAGLAGEFNRNVAGGAHLHNGVNGANGGVLVPLKTITSADNKSGQIVSDSNTITGITPDVALLIAGGSVYANIHSTTAPGGEIRGQLLQDPNNFPGAVSITSPKAGDTIKLDKGSKDSILTMTWDASVDPDGNPVVYKLQSSLLPDFSIILQQALLGANPSFTTTKRLLDDAIAPLVPIGGSITIPTRIIASDGSLNTIGTPYGLILQRVVSTGVQDEFVKSYAMAVFPVPASTYAMIEINAIKSGNIEMRVVDISGRMEHQQKVSLAQGVNRVTLDISRYTPGTHFIQMYQNGKNVAYFKLLKQ